MNFKGLSPNHKPSSDGTSFRNDVLVKIHPTSVTSDLSVLITDVAGFCDLTIFSLDSIRLGN